MLNAGTRADLYLNARNVGVLTVNTYREGWTFARFDPNPNFSEFASLFGGWSLFMHEDAEESLNRWAAEELHRVEMAIDSLHVGVKIEGTGDWHPVAQINIDGSLVEWKEV